MVPELTQEDFMALPPYHVYSSFANDGRNTGWFSGTVLLILFNFSNVDRDKIERGIFEIGKIL